MIKRFTPAYDRARDTAKTYKYSAEWHKYLTDEIAIKILLGSDTGPNSTYAVCLDKLRKKLKGVPSKSEGEVILAMAGITGSAPLSNAQADATATLKMLRHLYHLKDRGGQSVWIYAQPYSFHQWVFDEIKGCTPDSAKAKLDKIDEVYSDTVRSHMANGVQQTMAWSQKCVVQLASPDDTTKEIIKRWFFSGDVDDVAMRKASSTLLDGFKKFVALCNSSKLIFSDEPIDRMTGSTVAGQTNYHSNWQDYAFVAGGAGERLDVVYIQNATLKKWASPNESWMATLAILHELSHRLIKTKDAVYDFTGLKPGSVLTYGHAIANADSWAYFAADFNGQLPANEKTKVWKEPAALRARYLNSI